MLTTPVQKKEATINWHPADIKAALEKIGYSLSRLAKENGYSRSAPTIALKRPWPKMERIIAGKLGLKPDQIWPSRYLARGHKQYNSFHGVAQ